MLAAAFRLVRPLLPGEVGSVSKDTCDTVQTAIAWVRLIVAPMSRNED